jgi:hypothetical protein
MRIYDSQGFPQNAAIQTCYGRFTVDFPGHRLLDNKTAARSISGPPHQPSHKSSRDQFINSASVLAGSSQFAEANVGFLRRRTVRLGQILPDLSGFRVLAGGHQAAGF